MTKPSAKSKTTRVFRKSDKTPGWTEVGGRRSTVKIVVPEEMKTLVNSNLLMITRLRELEALLAEAEQSKKDIYSEGCADFAKAKRAHAKEIAAKDAEIASSLARDSVNGEIIKRNNETIRILAGLLTDAVGARENADHIALFDREVYANTHGMGDFSNDFSSSEFGAGPHTPDDDLASDVRRTE